MFDLLDVGGVLPYVIGALTLLIAFLIFGIIRAYHQARSSPYWRIRRQAATRAWRRFMLMMLAGLLLAGLLVVYIRDSGRDVWVAEVVGALLYTPVPRPTAESAMVPSPTVTASPSPTDTPTVTDTPTSSPTMTFTASPTPTLRPTNTIGPSPTPTDTPIPPTPTPTRPAHFITPIGSTVTPGPNARLRITAVATRVNAERQPLDAGSVFRAGFRRLYVFFRYYGMDSGVAWTRVLFRDGAPIQGGEYAWRSAAPNGETFCYFELPDGFGPGEYEVRFYIGLEQEDTIAFTVER